MKATKHQKKKFAQQYVLCVNKLIEELRYSEKVQLEALEDFDFVNEHDFEEAARKMFLEDVKECCAKMQPRSMLLDRIMNGHNK